MENVMLMPASYMPMSEEEMTYTDGGDALSAVSAAASLVVSALCIYNYATGLIAGRKFMAQHKGEDTDTLIKNATNEYVAYLKSGIINAVRGVHAGLCYVGLWPITLIALATV